MLRKSLIVLALVLMDSPLQQAFAGGAVVVLALTMHAAAKPFSRTLCNWMEGAILVIIVTTSLTILGGFVFIDPDASPALVSGVTWVLLALNAATAGTLVVLIVQQSLPAAVARRLPAWCPARPDLVAVKEDDGGADDVDDVFDVASFDEAVDDAFAAGTAAFEFNPAFGSGIDDA